MFFDFSKNTDKMLTDLRQLVILLTSRFLCEQVPFYLKRFDYEEEEEEDFFLLFDRNNYAVAFDGFLSIVEAVQTLNVEQFNL